MATAQPKSNFRTRLGSLVKVQQPQTVEGLVARQQQPLSQSLLHGLSAQPWTTEYTTQTGREGTVASRDPLQRPVQVVQQVE